ncbi:MAG: hypothetical protein FWC39_07945 [Bacteroidetes bacterium]|nr:hypothetical protein [Bacteroidota bacterium]
MATSQDLITRAQGVRDETQTGKNTAQRVGSLFNDIILFFVGAVAGKQDKQDNALKTASKEVVPAINEVHGNISILWGNVNDALGELEKDLTNDINAVKSKFPEGSGHVIAKYGTLELENPESFTKWFDGYWGASYRKWFDATPGNFTLSRKDSYGSAVPIFNVQNAGMSLNYTMNNGNIWDIFRVQNGSTEFRNVYEYGGGSGRTTSYFKASKDGNLSLRKEIPYTYGGYQYADDYSIFNVEDGYLRASKTYKNSYGQTSFDYFYAEDGNLDVRKMYPNGNQYSILSVDGGYISATTAVKNTHWGYEDYWAFNMLEVANGRFTIASTYQQNYDVSQPLCFKPLEVQQNYLVAQGLDGNTGNTFNMMEVYNGRAAFGYCDSSTGNYYYTAEFHNGNHRAKGTNNYEYWSVSEYDGIYYDYITPSGNPYSVLDVVASPQYNWQGFEYQQVKDMGGWHWQGTVFKATEEEFYFQMLQKLNYDNNCYTITGFRTNKNETSFSGYIYETGMYYPYTYDRLSIDKYSMRFDSYVYNSGMSYPNTFSRFFASDNHISATGFDNNYSNFYNPYFYTLFSVNNGYFQFGHLPYGSNNSGAIFKGDNNGITVSATQNDNWQTYFKVTTDGGIQYSHFENGSTWEILDFNKDRFEVRGWKDNYGSSTRMAVNDYAFYATGYAQGYGFYNRFYFCDDYAYFSGYDNENNQSVQYNYFSKDYSYFSAYDSNYGYMRQLLTIFGTGYNNAESAVRSEAPFIAEMSETPDNNFNNNQGSLYVEAGKLKFKMRDANGDFYGIELGTLQPL